MNSKQWELSILEFSEDGQLKYKVTRRLPTLALAETKIFNSKEEAIKQFNEWLE